MGGIPRLNLFGIPELRDPTGAVIKLRTKKQLGLLVYLTLEARARPVPRDTVIDLLWPDADSAHGRHSLAQALTAIRAGLGPSCLSRGGDGVRLLGKIETDLDGIGAQLERSDIECPLALVDAWAGTEFAHWVDGARQRCVRIVRENLRSALREHRTNGDAQMFRYAERLHQVDPLCEDAVVAIAEGALLRGNLGEAIETIRSHVREVKTVLDCSPTPEISRLLERLQSGSHAALSLVGPGRPETPNADPATVFVGRDAQLASLEAELEQVKTGASRRCLVTGPSGIGKSSLVRRFATGLMARGYPTFVVAAHGIGEHIPFATLSSLFSQMSLDPSASAADPLWLAEASRIHPTLRTRYPGIAAPSPIPPETIRIRLAEALSHLLDAIRDGGPAAIVIDDVEYVDPASSDVFYVFQQRLQDESTLLLGTAASGSAFRTHMRSRPNVERWDTTLTVPAMSNSEIREMLRVHSSNVPPSQRVADQIVELADGNPYFVEILLSDWRRHSQSPVVGRLEEDGVSNGIWDPPDSLRGGFAKLYSGLADETQRLLDILSVANRALHIVEAARALDVPEPAISARALDAVSRGIIRIEGSRLSFNNELHRRYVYYSMPGDARSLIHAGLARSLYPTSQTAGMQLHLERGHHLLRAGDTRKAYECLLDASRTAIAMGAVAEVRDRLAQMLPECPDEFAVELRATLADAEVALGRPDGALDALSPLGDSDGSPSEIATVRAIRLRAYIMSGVADKRTLRQSADDAVSTAVSCNDAKIMANALRAAAEAYGELGHMSQLRAVQAQCRTAVSGNADSDLTLTLTDAYCSLVGGRAGTAVHSFTSYLRRASEPAGLDYLKAQNGLGIALTASGEYTAAAQALMKADALAERLGNPSFQAISRSNLSVVYHDQGDFGNACAAIKSALGLDTSQVASRIRADILGKAAGLALDIGALDQADRYLTLAEDFVELSPVSRDRLDLSLIRADYHLATGELESAWTVLEDSTFKTERADYTLGEIARYERLRRHYELATRGYERYLTVSTRRKKLLDSLPTAGALEVAGFEAWAKRDSGANQTNAFLRTAMEAGMYGVLVHLAAIGTFPGRLAGAGSPAFRVLSTYGGPPTLVLPSRIDWEPGRGKQTSLRGA